MTMNPAHNAFNHIVAFDVGKESLAVCILPGDERHSIANKPKAIRKLLMAQMRRNANLSLGPLLVVCEATGGYERPLLEICIELGLPAHKAHGSRVRHFAKYLGLIAKTDPIDARALALYGLQTEGLRLYVPLTPELAALAALKARRDQIQAMLLAETSRLEHVRHPSVSRSLKEHIASLRKSLAALEAQIAAHIQASGTLARKAALMRSLKSIGPGTAAALLAYMPELGTFSRGQAASMAGLAPFDDKSGKSSLPSHIEAGRAIVRKALYMAALTAIRHNRIMKSFAERLRRNGKCAKAAITAVMRKLIVTLNAMLRSGEPWKHAQTA
ncbi:MAG: IS110 family transposase [Rhodomicrobium sp.]